MTDWSVEPLAPALGATVRGVDLAAPLDPLAEAALVELLAEHLVLRFPDQNLDPDRQVEVGTIFGEPFVHPFLEAIPDHPAILKVAKEPDDDLTFGGEFWHADITFMDPPSSASLLYSEIVPPVGGDTLFANQFTAFETLSAGMQSMLEGLNAVHLYPDMNEGEPNTTAVHPVVRIHPVSRRKALFVNAAFTERFEGMTAAESRPFLHFLYDHQTRPEFTTRLSWTVDQLTIWDNRAVLHYAMNDHQGHRRHLRRVTVMERPEQRTRR
ncbi:MAG: TauD/TfdA dioxygenase family protein [Acidimicrobiales bacterium]